MVVKIKKFCLTFDIEEFDADKDLDEEKKFEISLEGTKKIIELLKEEEIRGTFFITSKFALKYPEIVKEIAKNNEIGSHGYDHSDEYNCFEEEKCVETLTKSKKILEEISKKEVIGFRAPRMRTVNQDILRKAGFLYDSSSLPAFIPGRTRDFFKKRKMHAKKGIVIIPSSTTPIFRLPLMWISLRTLGQGYFRFVTKTSSIRNTYASTYFHPWEFIDLQEKTGKKSLITRGTGDNLVKIFKEYIRWCKPSYEFITMKELVQDFQKNYK